MSDPITTEAPVVEAVTVPIPDEAPTAIDHAAEAEKWKSLSRKNEERAKANEAAAKRLAEIEEANKSEAEKLQTRAELAEKKLAEREAADEAAALVKEIAAAKGVPESALRGSTREDLEAHADQLLALIPAVPAVPSADGLGKVGEPIGGAKQLTQSDLDRMSAAGDSDGIEKARVEGRFNTLLGITS